MQIRLIFIMTLLSGLSFVIGPSSAMAQPMDCAHLVWSDEFENAGAPDPARWNFEIGGGGWGNNEIQVYTDQRSNSYVSNGTLKIHALKSQSGTWTSARMVTSGKASWKYGRFEIRARLPSGRGTWPAIWMMPQSSVYGGWPRSGEIDIMEHVGYEMNKIHGTIHTEAFNHKSGTQKGGSITLPQVNNQFYVYAIEWTESEIRWYANDVLYFTFKNENKTYREWPFDQPFFLIMNIAIGGDWGGAQGIDPNLTEALMEIDYVRVYSTSIARPVISGPSLIDPGSELILTTPALGQLQYRWNLPEGVTMVSGAGTNTIVVRWNNQPGSVTVDAYNACDTVRSNPFAISLQSKPTGEYWPVPVMNTEGELHWKAVPGDGNQITISPDGTGMNISYNIQMPSANPYIYCDLPAATDLTGHREMWVQIKAATGQLPGNIRIDLVDMQGQVDLNSLFKIDGEEGTGDFKTYSYLYRQGTSGWQLNRIVRIRIYFNYGILGRKGSGQFSMRDMKMRNPNYTSLPPVVNQSGTRAFPNPVTGWINIHGEKPISRITMTHVTGQLVYSEQIQEKHQALINLSHMKSGLYIVTLFGNSGWREEIRIIKK